MYVYEEKKTSITNAEKVKVQIHCVYKEAR